MSQEVSYKNAQVFEVPTLQPLVFQNAQGLQSRRRCPATFEQIQLQGTKLTARSEANSVSCNGAKHL